MERNEKKKEESTFGDRKNSSNKTSDRYTLYIYIYIKQNTAMKDKKKGGGKKRHRASMNVNDKRKKKERDIHTYAFTRKDH